MSDLNISGATQGYDNAGIRKAIDDINTNVFMEAADVIDKEVPHCRQAIDEIWKGQSADAFKAKLERDSQTIMNDLRNLRESIEGQFATIAKTFDNTDSNVADVINNM